VENRNLVFEHRFPAAKPERFHQFAAELVALKPDVIVAVTPLAATAMQKATESIPIVFAFVGDAVALGLVKSIARPGGNLTGLTILSPELYAKRAELLLEILPGTRRIGVAYHPAHPMAPVHLRELEEAAKHFGLTLRARAILNAGEIETA